MKKMIAGAAALALLGSASMALDSSREVYFQSGTHQFYVWCTGGAAGETATSDGATAEEAQKKLYDQLKAGGKTSCWPVWQGKV